MILTKRLIPCLDVTNGRVVKGVNFKNLQDTGDPVKIASIYNMQGADEIIFLDITSTINNNGIILDIIKKVSSKVFIPLTVGGGIKNINDVHSLLNSGADKVAINSAAVNNPYLITEISNIYGSQCVVVAIDVKYTSYNKWEVFINSGKINTNLDAIKWAIKMSNLGAGELLITSMDKDGTCNGFDLDIIYKISNLVNIPIIASGGVGNLQDLCNGIFKGDANAVLAASIFHYGNYNIFQAKHFMLNKNIPIRLMDYE